MGKEVGTLEELNLKPGDVVECVATFKGGNWTVGKTYLMGEDGVQCDIAKPQKYSLSAFRIVSRAIDTPKLWRDMTDAEQGALLLAHHRGVTIERLRTDGVWKTIENPSWSSNLTYRVKIEPKIDTKTVWYSKIGATIYEDNGWAHTHKITFDLVDGEPDVSTVKMEKL